MKQIISSSLSHKPPNFVNLKGINGENSPNSPKFEIFVVTCT